MRRAVLETLGFPLTRHSPRQRTVEMLRILRNIQSNLHPTILFLRAAALKVRNGSRDDINHLQEV